MSFLNILADYKWATFVASLVCWAAYWYWRSAVMSVPKQKLIEAQTAETKYDLMDLQLYFYRGHDPATILGSWNAEARQYARESLRLDYWLMPTYAFGIASLCLFAAAAPIGDWRTAFLWLGAMPLGAWIFDIIENITELALLEPPQGTIPAAELLYLAALATSLKWLLLGTSFLIGAAGFVVSFIWVIWNCLFP